MRPRQRLAALVGALALVLSSPAFAELPVKVLGGNSNDATEQADGRVLHNASGFQFPSMLGDMPLHSITIYGPGDASVIYGQGPMDTQNPWITMYIYPARLSLDEEEKAVVDGIRQAWTASPANSPTANLKIPANGRSGWFQVSQRDVAGIGGYLLAQRDGWFMKSRFTIPQASGQAGIERATAAVNSADWAWTPSREPAAEAPANPVASLK